MDKKESTQIIRKLAQNYNSIATEWDVSRTHPTKLKLQSLEPIKAKMKVLDLGCGNGLMIPTILAKKAKYFGIDISSKLVQIAEKKYAKQHKNIDLQVGMATALPYKDDFFDFAISYAVLHHIPSDELRLLFFKELHRVLKKDAQAVIKVWNLESDWAFKRFNIARQLKDNPERDVYIPWKATKGKDVERYLHLFTVEELQELASKAGFQDIKIEFYTQKGEKVENGEETVVSLKKII